jgi:hypothetical protein
MIIVFTLFLHCFNHFFVSNAPVVDERMNADNAVRFILGTGCCVPKKFPLDDFVVVVVVVGIVVVVAVGIVDDDVNVDGIAVVVGIVVIVDDDDKLALFLFSIASNTFARDSKAAAASGS